MRQSEIPMPWPQTQQTECWDESWWATWNCWPENPSSDGLPPEMCRSTTRPYGQVSGVGLPEVERLDDAGRPPHPSWQGLPSRGLNGDSTCQARWPGCLERRQQIHQVGQV
jgi:hypothetical protein